MRRKLFFINLFGFLLFGLFSAFPEDTTTDLKNRLVGTIKKNPGSWYISMKYNDMKIDGNFYKPAPVEMVIDSFIIELEINKLKYKGNLLFKKPMVGPDYYEFLNMKLNKKDLDGQIRKDFKNTYRKDVFDCTIEDNDLTGYLEFFRTNKNVSINLKNNETPIIGMQIQKDIYLKNISLRFGDKKLTGTVRNDRPFYKYNFQTAGLTEEDLFLFLFIEMYLLIDEENYIGKK
jgi:hypothetical protein